MAQTLTPSHVCVASRQTCPPQSLRHQTAMANNEAFHAAAEQLVSPRRPTDLQSAGCDHQHRHNELTKLSRDRQSRHRRGRGRRGIADLCARRTSPTGDVVAGWSRDGEVVGSCERASSEHNCTISLKPRVQAVRPGPTRGEAPHPWLSLELWGSYFKATWSLH